MTYAHALKEAHAAHVLRHKAHASVVEKYNAGKVSESLVALAWKRYCAAKNHHTETYFGINWS